MNLDPADQPIPHTIPRHAIGDGDLVIPKEEIESLIRRGELTGPEELMSKLGDLGIHAFNVDLDGEGAKLITFNPELDGPLGAMDRSKFDEALAADVNTPVTSEELTDKIWQALVDVSVDNAQIINDWNNRSLLNKRLGLLHEQINGERRRERGSSKLEGLYNLRTQITNRLSGMDGAYDMPPSAAGLIIGKPFMMVERVETVGGDEETYSSGKTAILDAEPGDQRGVFINLDALYDFLVITEDSLIGDLGNVRPLMVNMVNSRILAARANRGGQVLGDIPGVFRGPSSPGGSE
ncbi:MAG TPA: hypothetical protein VII55_01760 [Candidatus Saccharimonadales bacterium]